MELTKLFIAKKINKFSYNPSVRILVLKKCLINKIFECNIDNYRIQGKIEKLM